MELVTGRAGVPHITSQQHRQMHQGIWGEEAYILSTGNMLEPEVQSSNKILIKDGALMFQGALFSVKVGTTDEITINNGNQGMKRKDLVVARYTYDQSQNIEKAEWKVIQGTPAESNPVAPSGTSGDIQAGDSVVDCPFMIVNLDGINVTGVDIIPEISPTISDLNGKLMVDYSETASETHETVNGNQVRVKTYELSSLPENGEKDYSLAGLSNARYIWIDTSMSYVYSPSDSYPQIYPFPYVSPTNVRDSISFIINNDAKTIKIRTGTTGWTPYRAYIAVKYY